MRWLLKHTEKFPKSERFRMAKRLDDSLFLFHEYLMEAVYVQNKSVTLQKADLTLSKLRLYLRLSHDLGLTQTKQYEFALELLLEIGKLLGGWIKSTR